jgi:hypothetical protein
MEDKRPRGRPPKAESERGAKYNVYLPPDLAEWLKAQPGGMSPAIQDLARKAISKQKKRPSQ